MGIIMGLGFSFMLAGIRMMSQGWIVGGAALAATLLLLTNRAIPPMFLLLIGEAVTAVVQNPALLGGLASIHVDFRLPSSALGGMTWHEQVVDSLYLALPQIPLTLGNAIVAVTEENNELFPDRPVSEKKVAISTGVINLLGPLVGGVPMCHGADRRCADHPRRHRPGHRPVLQQLGADDLRDLPGADPQRDPVPRRRAARPRLVRLRQEQERALREPGDGGLRDLEHRSRVRVRDGAAPRAAQAVGNALSACARGAIDFALSRLSFRPGSDGRMPEANPFRLASIARLSHELLRFLSSLSDPVLPARGGHHACPAQPQR